MMVVFLILNYNSSDDLRACADSIEKNCKSFNIVVVDNGSKDNDSKCAETLCKERNYIFIKSKTNLGFARGNNLGFAYIRENISCDYIAMINSDTLLIDDRFEDSLNEAYERYQFAVLGPDILPAHSNPMRDDLRDIKAVEKRIKEISRINTILKIPFINISYLLINKLLQKAKKINQEHLNATTVDCELHGSFLVFSKLYELKGICEKTFLYGEEDILVKQCRDRGYITLYYPQIKVIHNESIATKKSLPNVVKRKQFYYKHRMVSLMVLKEEYIVSDRNGKA